MLGKQHYEAPEARQISSPQRELWAVAARDVSPRRRRQNRTVHTQAKITSVALSEGSNSVLCCRPTTDVVGYWYIAPPALGSDHLRHMRY